MPVASVTLDSPNLSRSRSAAASASFQRCCRLPSSRLICSVCASNDDACTPCSRTWLLCFQFLRNSARTGDRAEVFVTQFELNGASVEVRFPQAASHHFGEAHQRGFELIRVGRV